MKFKPTTHDKILVKSIHTGETKTIDRPPVTIRRDLKIENLRVQPDGIRAKRYDV